MAANRHLAAIMFTDLVGFTASARVDETAALARLKEYEDILRPIVQLHSGREVKSTGDGSLVEFDSAVVAAECAVDILRRLMERNAQNPRAPIGLRIGIHVGEVTSRDGDIFGDAVNIASRVQAHAEPGGICITGPVRDLVGRKLSETITPLGLVPLKGVQDPVELYRITLAPSQPSGESTGAAPPRLAVLPLTNISPDDRDEYFADGLTEELIAVLSKIRGLRVIARTSVTQYKNSPKPISQIGSELGVQSILEGSVRKAGNRLRITLQLIDVGSQEHRWSEVYDRDLDDVFVIQSEVAERTATSLSISLNRTEKDAIHRASTADPLAHEYYLKGIQQWRQDLGRSHEEGAKLLQEAIRRDPTFSLAYAALAHIYLQAVGDTLAGNVAFPRIRSLVEQAIRLDPASSEAHAAWGSLAMQGDLDWVTSEREFRRALELNPSSADAEGWYGLLCETLQRFPEAIQHYRRAIDLAPRWPVLRTRLATTYQRAGDIQKSIDFAKQCLEDLPGSPQFHSVLASGYLGLGRTGEAEAEAALHEVSLMHSFERGAAESEEAYADRLASGILQARLEARLGRPDMARRLLERLLPSSETLYVPAPRIASLWAALGENDKALTALERDLQGGDRSLWFSYQDEAFDGIREDPRFVALLEASHLPTNLPARASVTMPRG